MPHRALSLVTALLYTISAILLFKCSNFISIKTDSQTHVYILKQINAYNILLYKNIGIQTIDQLMLNRDYPMNKKLSLLFTAMFLGACAQDRSPLVEKTNPVVSNQTLSVVQAIPKPSQMIADVSTNSRVSTIKHIDVAYVQQSRVFSIFKNLPETTN